LFALSWSLVLTGLFCTLVLWAGLRDLVSMTISNRLVLVLLSGFIVAVVVGVVGPVEAAVSLAAAFGVLVLGFVLFALGWIGGGDAKLMAVTALWFGPTMTANYLVYTTLFGAALTVALLVFRRHPLLPVLRSVAWLDRLHAPATGVPYGVAMAMGALVTVYLGPAF
jgi:prepilin peptidase CpaA